MLLQYHNLLDIKYHLNLHHQIIEVTIITIPLFQSIKKNWSKTSIFFDQFPVMQLMYDCLAKILTKKKAIIFLSLSLSKSVFVFHFKQKALTNKRKRNQHYVA
jgi:hypothetical protein